MAKANTIQAKVQAVAKAMARQPIMDTLALAVRKAAPRPRPEPSPLRQAVQQQDAARPKRAVRRSSRVGFRRYKVNLLSAPGFHKRGTWTRFMLKTIVAHTDTRAATEAHKTSGQYPEKTLDFNWSVKQGYIEYV